MLLVKVGLADEPKGASYIDLSENVDIAALFDGAEVGDGYILTLVEMDKEEFESLSEFEGF